jgi:hypothetical protein
MGQDAESERLIVGSLERTPHGPITSAIFAIGADRFGKLVAVPSDNRLPLSVRSKAGCIGPVFLAAGDPLKAVIQRIKIAICHVLL